jgi:hypothetical protein
MLSWNSKISSIIYPDIILVINKKMVKKLNIESKMKAFNES